MRGKFGVGADVGAVAASVPSALEAAAVAAPRRCAAADTSATTADTV